MNPVAEMILSEPTPAAIWAALMLLCLPAVFLLANPQNMRHPRLAVLDLVDVLRTRLTAALRFRLAGARRPRLAVLDLAGVVRRRADARLQLQAEAVEVLRYADEMRVAADQSASAAQRWEKRRDRAATATTLAWKAWQEADSDLTRLRAAAAYANPWTPRTPAEYADRERYLHRVVRAAADRGDLASDDLTGFDPTLHPFDQDVALARAIVAHRRAAYDRAVAAEETAAHDAQLAARSRDSLRREYVAAAVHATEVHHLAPAKRPAPRSGRRPVVARAA